MDADGTRSKSVARSLRKLGSKASMSDFCSIVMPIAFITPTTKVALANLYFRRSKTGIITIKVDMYGQGSIWCFFLLEIAFMKSKKICYLLHKMWKWCSFIDI